MTKQEFTTLVRGMKAAYSDPKFLPDEYAVTVWYGMLKDIPYKDANKAIADIMRTSPYPPTIADITQKVYQANAKEEMSGPEAWSYVRKAIQNSNYNSEQEFAKLPRSVQKAIGTSANLKELAAMDAQTVESVEQSHFIRAYRTVLDRERMDEQANLPTLLEKKRAEEKRLEKVREDEKRFLAELLAEGDPT